MLSRWHGGDRFGRVGRGEGVKGARVAAAARAKLWRSARQGLTHRQWGAADEEVLPRVFAQLGLYVLHECRGPMRLWDFSRRLALRLGMRHKMPPVELCDAVRATLESTNHPRLRLLAPATRGTGAGYVYDAADPDSWPLRI